MGRGDDRGGRTGLDAASVMVAGSAFLQEPFVQRSLGWGPSRHHGGGRSLARRVLDWHRGADETVTCIACGETVPRSDAREYDKHGDRFDRRNKEFEHLCKRCHRDIDHKPRRDLEGMLVEFEAREDSREAFLAWYCGRVEERYGPLEEEE
jgi:hypothetical protein